MNKKRLLAILLALVIGGGSIFGVAQIAKAASRSTVMVLPVSSVNYGRWWWDDSSSLEGLVTADASQNVFLTSTQTVEKVYVEEGQAVRAGDTLMTYDTTQTGLNLEREKLSREQIALRIEVAKKNIETLKKLSPVSEGGDDFGFFDDFGFDEPEEEPREIKAKVHDILDDTAEPYDLLGDKESWGSEMNPYRYICTDGTEITAAFLEKLAKEAGGNPLYYVLEIREGNRPDGALIKAWTENAAKIGEIPPEWKGSVSLAGEVVITPAPTDEPEPTDVPGPTDYPAPTDIPTPTEEPQPTEEPVPTDVPAPTEEPAPTDIPAPTDPTEPLVPGSDEPVNGQDGPVSGQDAGFNMAAGSGEMIPHLSTQAGADSGEAVTLTWETVAAFKAMVTAAEEDSGRRGLAEAVGLIPADAQYTADELRRALQDEESDLRSLELDLREADLKIRTADRAVGEGEVKAKMNGIVKKVGDPENPANDGSAFIEVAAAEGLYVRSALNERAYGHVKEGDSVTVTSWQSGQTFEGVIREISDFPDSSGMFGYGSNSETFYPMTISVGGNTNGLNSYEWVQVQLNPQPEAADEEVMMEDGEIMTDDGDIMGGADSSDTLTIPKAFVRDEDDGKYVFIRGEDDKLVRRAVVTGPLKDESYEILEGLTNDDWIAFPYGKAVKEGARTREGSMEELYES